MRVPWSGSEGTSMKRRLFTHMIEVPGSDRPYWNWPVVDCAAKSLVPPYDGPEFRANPSRRARNFEYQHKGIVQTDYHRKAGAQGAPVWYGEAGPKNSLVLVKFFNLSQSISTRSGTRRWPVSLFELLRGRDCSHGLHSRWRSRSNLAVGVVAGPRAIGTKTSSGGGDERRKPDNNRQP